MLLNTCLTFASGALTVEHILLPAECELLQGWAGEPAHGEPSKSFTELG